MVRKSGLKVGLAISVFAALVIACARTPGEATSGSPKPEPTGSSPASAVIADARAQAPGNPSDDSTRDRSPAMENPFPRRVKAPPLTGGIEWLNCAGPIELEHLRGKIVLLDFWTYCCINCMHILPELKRLEQKYADTLVVIGVHSAKFFTERDSENIREAIKRYEIEHPVVNDARMLIWRRYGVRAWPTLVLIDPEGYAVLKVSGEGWFDVIERAIEALIAYHSAKGTLKRGRLFFGLETQEPYDTPLRFPGKVHANAEGNRLFVTDSNHNRIVICDLNGRLIDIIGSGEIGREDGTFETATFFRPQGTFLVGNTLYIADTENHLIRAADLESRTVRTVVGTGEQGWQRPVEAVPARATPISSPWDICWIDGKLYIAMAGVHQIWVYDPSDDTVRVFAGSGREGILDGEAALAEFAQPSGLSTDGARLFVADAESSAVRIVYPRRGGFTETVVGLGLFEFGDRDGVGSAVRLQHPLAVQYWKDDLVFVADTYNNKIKLLDVVRRRCRTWAGKRESGKSLDPVTFNEPGGLAIAGNHLFVADTNNHRIVAIDLKTSKARELEITGLKPPASRQHQLGSNRADTEAIVLPVTRVAPGGKLIASVRIQLPDGLKLNPLAPMGYTVRRIDEPPATLVSQRLSPPRTDFTIELPGPAKTERATVEIALQYFPCEVASEGVCYVAHTVWRIPLEVAEGAPEAAEVQLVASFVKPDEEGPSR